MKEDSNFFLKTEECQSLKITLQLFLKKYGSVGDENNKNKVIQLNCYNTGLKVQLKTGWTWKKWNK